MSSTSRQINQVQVTRVYSPKLTHSGLLVSRAISTTNFSSPSSSFHPPPLSQTIRPWSSAYYTGTCINVRLIRQSNHTKAELAVIGLQRRGGDYYSFFLRHWVIQPITLRELTAYRSQFTNGVAVECSIWSLKCAFYIVGAILISKYRK